MKKKILSLFLCAMLILSLMPAAVFAAGTDTWAVSLDVSENSIKQYNSQNTLKVSFGVQSDNLKLKNAQSIIFAVDLDVFDMITTNASKVSSLSKTLSIVSSTVTGKYKIDDDNTWAASAYYALSDDNKTGYIQILPSYGDAETECVTKVSLASILLGFKSGKSLSDVTAKSIRFVNKDELTALNQNSAVEITDGASNTQSAIMKDNTSDTLKITPVINWGTITPAKETPEYTVPTNLTATYGDTLAKVTFPTADNGTWSWADSTQSVGKAGTNTFKAVFTPTDTNTYKTVENIDVNVTVNAQNITDVAVGSIADQEYTGSKIEPEVTVTGDGGKTLILDKDYTVTYGENVAVGANGGSVTVKAKENGNYTFSDVTKKFNIVARAGIISITGSLSKTYNGEAVSTDSLTVNKNGSTGVVTYKFYTNEACTGDGTETAPANAGKYWVKAEMAADLNYGSATSDALAFEISRASITPAVNITGWIYGSAANAPSVTGNTGSGEVTYAYKVKDAADSTYAATVPANAGNYTVKATVAQTTNYNSGTATADFTISVKNISEVTVGQIEAQTYSGNAVTPKPTVKDNLTDLVESKDFTYSYTNNMNAGTATVKITGKGNYTGEKTAEFTINKADPTYTVGTTKQIKVGSSLSVFTAVAPAKAKGVKNEDVAGTVKWYKEEGRTTEAGESDVSSLAVNNTLTLYWTFTPSSTNYNTAQDSVTFTIVEGDPQNISFEQNAVNKVYGDAPFTNGASNKTNDDKAITDGGTISWASDSTSVATVDENGKVTIVGQGTTTITATAAKVAGKYAVGTKSYTLTVTKRPVTITGVTAGNKEYDGNTTATVSGTPVINNLVEGDSISVTNGTAAFDSKTVGKDKTVTFTGFSLSGDKAGNYELTQPASVKADITQKEVSITGVTATARGYNGSRDVTLTGATLSGVVDCDTVSVAGGKGTVESADAGENKAVTVTGYELTGKDKANYKLAGQPENIKVTISKIVNSDVKNAKVTEKYGSDATVDISTLLKPGYVIGTISKTDNESIISSTPEFADGKLTFKVAEGTEDKTATVTVLVTEATNYNAYDITVAVTATAKTVPVIDAKDYVTTYNGKDVDIEAITKTAKADGKEIAGTWSFDGTYNLKNANTGIPVVIKFTATGDDAADYAAATAVIKVTINKAKPTGTPAYTKITADGKTLADASIGTGNITPNGTIAWDRPADVAVEKNTAYSWTFTPTDTANYEVLTGSITPYYVAAPTPGGGGGGAIVTPTTDKDVVTDKTSEATTTTVKETKTETVKNEAGQNVSKTTATVSADTAKELVNQAVSNKSKTIEITVKSTGGKADGETATELAIPKSAVESIVKDTEASLVVKTDSGEVTLDNKALETIAAETDGDTVKIVVGEDVQLSEDQKPAKDAIGDRGKIFDLRAVAGNKYVHDFKGGKAHVAVPVPEKLKGKDIAIIYINDKGLCEILNHTMQAVGADSFIKFTTTHFSTFAVVEKADAEKLVKQQNADKVKTLIKEVSLKATTTRTSKKNIKVKVAEVDKTNSLIKEIESMGYTVKYRFCRSTKASSSYVGKKTKAAASWINTSGKKGTKYYYKAKAYVYDGKTLIAKTALKQCKYSVRTWSK